MIYTKLVPVLEDRHNKTSKKHGQGHLRITIPVEIRNFVKISKQDFIEWKVDTIKKTLTGKLIKNDNNKNTVKGWFPKK
jgi:hypothetical protein